MTDGPPFVCISTGCHRYSRAKLKPTYCNTCYSRRSTGASPKFPADPLLDYVEARGLQWRGAFIPKRGGKVTLERMDELCIEWLEVHPYEVYGDLYFMESVS